MKEFRSSLLARISGKIFIIFTQRKIPDDLTHVRSNDEFPVANANKQIPLKTCVAVS